MEGYPSAYLLGYSADYFVEFSEDKTEQGLYSGPLNPDYKTKYSLAAFTKKTTAATT